MDPPGTVRGEGGVWGRTVEGTRESARENSEKLDEWMEYCKDEFLDVEETWKKREPPDEKAIEEKIAKWKRDNPPDEYNEERVAGWPELKGYENYYTDGTKTD